ncbi:DUF3604 domain-containing protein [Microbulbifer elongatus]|uniref:DUF3604 domain-containing protein n=1 Tax=Microbulbifer elongatus TaxID=86173 RepID=UPI0038995524
MIGTQRHKSTVFLNLLLHFSAKILRTIAIPTPRRSTYAAVRCDLPVVEGTASIQERTWSSPIRHSPAATNP